MVDFTLEKYAEIIETARAAGYGLTTLANWFEGKDEQEPQFLIRHDVDRHPERALAMAELEAEKNVAASYYFRSVPCSFDPQIIQRIASLGHEIGYHYEDWYTARYDPAKAIELYRKNLARLRKIAPVTTIAMHGSPLAKESNMAIWDHYDLSREGVKDVIKSADFSSYTFFTDTGRTFGQSRANLRDFVGSEVLFDEIKSSDDLISFIKHQAHDLIYFSVHPERWTDQSLAWGGQYIKDKTVNGIKLGLRLVR